MPRITRHNTVDENEIRIDESKVAKASKLVTTNSNNSNENLNEVTENQLIGYDINSLN